MRGGGAQDDVVGAEAEGRRKIVGDIYLRFLRRDCRASECTGWVSQLASGKTEVDVGVGLVHVGILPVLLAHANT